MRRMLSVVAVVALLAMLLPATVVAAQGGSNRGADNSSRITICHSPNGVNPQAITINKAAWKAHEAHGDFLVTTSKPCVPRQGQGGQGALAPNTCMFSAATSQYLSAVVPPATVGALFATGPIQFQWDTVTKAVLGGYWDEHTVADPATKLHNEVTAGTVTGTAVSLTFTRTIVPPPNYVFPFTGTLTSASPGPATLAGTMAGPAYGFTASGTVRCRSGGQTGS